MWKHDNVKKYLVWIIVIFVLAIPILKRFDWFGGFFNIHKVKVVYLVDEPGGLDQRELVNHPEIIVTNSFRVFKRYAKSRAALWIDKFALKKLSPLDKSWFQLAPQTYYPIAVVGYGDKNFAFGKTGGLELCCDLGPMSDASIMGFSVIQNDEKHPGTNNFWAGYESNNLHVEDVLRVTNALMDGSLPEKVPDYIPAASPTLPF